MLAGQASSCCVPALTRACRGPCLWPQARLPWAGCPQRGKQDASREGTDFPPLDVAAGSHQRKSSAGSGVRLWFIGIALCLPLAVWLWKKLPPSLGPLFPPRWMGGIYLPGCCENPSPGVPWRHGRSAPRHRNAASRHVFAEGGSCLQFIKHTASVKHNKAKLGTMRGACR